jgi:Integrase core domain
MLRTSGCAMPSITAHAHSEFDSEHPGYCLAQDTFYVGTSKGVGRVYQQTVIDTYSKVGFAKLYTRKTPLTAADTLNDRVIPFFDEHEIHIGRILTDRGTEYRGAHDRHEYELYLAVEDIDHTRTKVKEPANQWHLRALPQDIARRVLSRGIPQKALRHPGCPTGRPQCVDGCLQRAAHTPGSMVFRQDPNADLPRQCCLGTRKTEHRQGSIEGAHDKLRSGGHPPRPDRSVRSNTNFYTSTSEVPEAGLLLKSAPQGRLRNASVGGFGCALQTETRLWWSCEDRLQAAGRTNCPAR